MPIDSTKYVVMDVETNGLASLKHDLLCISIYMPDTGKTYERFLPLELNETVLTSEINGITANMLQDALPLNQAEVDWLIERFDLRNRTILTYGSLDEKFIRNYLKRKKLRGYDCMSFYNFKHDIISSWFSGGNITKDNLCKLFNIENVTDVHNALNDCFFEWQLFEKMDGKKLIITDDKVFIISQDYYIPASYLQNYPNIKYYAADLPCIDMSLELDKEFDISDKFIYKLPTNFNGMIIEHLLNSLIQAQKVDSTDFLIKNKSKCKYIGKLPTVIDKVYFDFEPNGFVTAVNEKDKKLEKELNSVIGALKRHLKPVVDYITTEIFKGTVILTQELVKYDEYKVMALCDLSNDNTVLEIKSNNFYNPECYADQLFYEANGRECFLLQVAYMPSMIKIKISKASFNIPIYQPQERVSMEKKIQRLQDKIKNDSIEILKYVNRESPVTVKCKKCGNEWETSCYKLIKEPVCRKCIQSEKTNETSNKSSKPERKIVDKEMRFRERVFSLSNNTIVAYNFIGSRSEVNAVCLTCKYSWKTRADKLLEKPSCPQCRKLPK